MGSVRRDGVGQLLETWNHRFQSHGNWCGFANFFVYLLFEYGLRSLQNFPGANQNFLDTSTNVARMTSFQIPQNHEPRPSKAVQKWNEITTFLEENRQHIFYIFVFYVTTFVLFFERYFCKWNTHRNSLLKGLLLLLLKSFHIFPYYVYCFYVFH